MLLRQYWVIQLSEDCVLVVNSGRYEFRNKGVDILIDSLGEMQKKDASKKNVLPFSLYLPIIKDHVRI